MQRSGLGRDGERKVMKAKQITGGVEDKVDGVWEKGFEIKCR